ncbi:MAG: glycosyl hydrolase [Gammaproteobacteria bacterium]|nr:glycosyl hydrolase [Gammaproteobacteria bacterium]MBT8437953.1 glycosyl hydrolase [Gammaproteobacteria bacterium]
MSNASEPNYGLTSSSEVLLTSEAGDKLTRKDNITFYSGVADAENIIRVRPDVIRQTLHGIGSSFTEASAFVLAHLDQENRSEVMNNIYGQQGANFSLARTPIGATDFCIDGKYSYAAVADDNTLAHFSIAVDQDGFSAAEHDGIKDERFDLLPMIQQALAIKNGQHDADLRIIASPWTAPPWMKDIEDWYRPGSAEADQNGTGGSLKPEYVETFADYIVRYLDAYKQEGVPVWGLTPINEPQGNSGQWESMHFTPESQRDFIKTCLGPKLKANGYQDVGIFMLDHSRGHLEQWADVIYTDPGSAKFVSGAAVHWYESTFKVYEDVLGRVHDKFPGFSIINTEACIDDLGNDAPPGVLDPIGYKESGWFDNDDFWWNQNASDWAYSVTWEGVNAADHPKYTPVHRYARNIIVSLNHWVSGWIDWNVVLDARGGPNHVGNYCGAPIMIDTGSGYVYYTPIYYILAQFSRTIRPGDHAVQTDKIIKSLDQDAIHASASVSDANLLTVQVLNTTKKPVDFLLQVGEQHADVTIAANALQTLRVPLR